MSGNLSYLNPGGVQARKQTALAINIGAARGLQDVLRTNLGPRGTMKMLVGGAGQIKITKDGNTLLGEMQIQHPTASLIARTATATDDNTGDGSTTTVLLIGEMLRQCERYIQEGLHPRQLSDGFETAKREAVKFLNEQCLVPIPEAEMRDYLLQVARTALSTKVGARIKDSLAASVVDAVLCISADAKNPIDLHMVEVMHMKHRLSQETQFVQGIVLDHGGRNADMPKRLENVYVLTCNISLEYEKSELAAGFYYQSPEEKAKMAESERKLTDEKTNAIIALKKRVCTKENGRQFVVINQKGIDQVALEMLAREGILALRRAKRRNMERMVLACGGEAVSSHEGMTPEMLGEAACVYEHTLGDEKYTFIETMKKGTSCTLLVKGATDHSIAQVKDAIRDGLRAVKNAIEDGAVIAGAGAFEVAVHDHLWKYADTIPGKAKLGIRAYADGLLVVPKTLAENSGLDMQASLIAVQDASREARAKGRWAGLDIETGEPIDPIASGIYDNVAVKRALLECAGVIASQLLLVDEIMKAGRRGMGAPPGDE